MIFGLTGNLDVTELIEEEVEVHENGQLLQTSDVTKTVALPDGKTISVKMAVRSKK